MIHVGDALAILRTMEAESVHCCVTSPPYWGLRDYGVSGQLGLEKTFQEYIVNMVAVFSEVRRVLRSDGTLWLNVGDSYSSQGGRQVAQTKWQVHGASDGQNGGKSRVSVNGLKAKDLCMIPARLAIALQDDGWYLRSDIIWSKPNPMPESVTDRPTKAHEYLFLLAKSERYYYDAAAIAETCGGFNGSTFTKGKTADARKHLSAIGQRERVEPTERNKRSVWTVATQPFPEAHFATFPEDLIQPCILAGCPAGGVVLDPFAGSGTTGVVAEKFGRRFVGIELNSVYAAMAERRIDKTMPLLAGI